MNATLCSILLVFVGWAGAEILGHLYFRNPYLYYKQRFLYTSPDSFRNIENFWTYKPNTRIDEIAIYRTPFGHYFQEYECHYETDKMGFLDNLVTEGPKYNVLLLGDSFTAGSGGCSWMSMLRAKVPGYSIYNAGLPGTGVENWAEIQQYLTKAGYEFDQVIMVFISSDFTRPLRQKSDRELDCLHDVTRCTLEVYYPLNSSSDLRDISRQRMNLWPDRATAKMEYFLQKYFWVSHFIVTQSFRMFWKQDGAASRMFDQAMSNAFTRIVHTSKKLNLIRITTKNEVALGANDHDTRIASKFLASHGVRYDTCALSYDEFLPYDGHPNARGYDRVAECVSKVVRQSRLATENSSRSH